MMEKNSKKIVEEIFNTMPARFRPEGAGGIEAVFGYDITGVGKWRLSVSENRMHLEKTEDLSGCDCVLCSDAETFAGINTGTVDAMAALTRGRMKVTGDFSEFSKTTRLFVRYTVPGQDRPSEEELVAIKRTISIGQRFATGPVMGKFLDALKEKRILAIQCPECGRLQSPPREACAVCRKRNTTWKEIGPKGEMRMLEYCYYASPDPLTGETRETPYGAVGILLDGCKDDEVFWHLLNPAQLDAVKMGIVLNGRVVHGTRLRPVWAENRTGSISDIKYFEIDEEV